MSNNSQPKNVAVWFEIPASDFGRAAGFYETILATTLKHEQFGGAKIASAASRLSSTRDPRR